MKKNKIHKDICDTLNYIYEAKNADYGDSFARVRREEGESTILVRLKDKLYRLETLLHGEVAKVEEKAEDTLLDMANYCIMELVERQAEKAIEDEVRQEVREIMCGSCPNAKEYYDECGDCDEFTNVVELCMAVDWI